MEKEFTPISLDARDDYYKIWDATPLVHPDGVAESAPCRSLDYTLANLWGWQEYFGLEWKWAGDLLWIRQTRPREIWWAPLGDWTRADWRSVLPLCAGAREFTRIPQELAEKWQAALPQAAAIAEERGQWEYIYAASDLASLSGNKLHRKRNHYNAYVKAYGEPDYRPVSDTMVDDVLACQDDWCQWHECEDSPSLQAENEAINRVLTHWGKFRQLQGGSLYLEGKMIAFSVGEGLDQETIGIHFEKGLNGYKGVYQAINLQFVRHAPGYSYVDRAQDMDEEGLRKAKMSYVPLRFLKKCQVTLSL